MKDKHSPSLKKYDSKFYGVTRNRITKEAYHVVETLQKAGYDAVIVGGAVRDLLLNKNPKDYDVATNASPNAVKRLFRRSFIIGRRFKIVHVHMGADTIIEVTTYRADEGNVTNNQGRIMYDNNYGDQMSDAARRDFTSNALYYDPMCETIYDYHGGMEDLMERRLVMIGDPRTRFREDPVRMLRAIRLSRKLGLEIDDDVMEAIIELFPLIKMEPPARLFDEITKLLTCGRSVSCFVFLLSLPVDFTIHPFFDYISKLDKRERNFVRHILHLTDERVARQDNVSLGFIFAGLYWLPYKKLWASKCRQKQDFLPASQWATKEFEFSPLLRWSVPHRVVIIAKSIWTSQPFFQLITRNRPMRFSKNSRFKIALDFFLVRSEFGELPAELVNWWADFLQNRQPERMQMCMEHYKTIPAFAYDNEIFRRDLGESRDTMSLDDMIDMANTQDGEYGNMLPINRNNLDVLANELSEIISEEEAIPNPKRRKRRRRRKPGGSQRPNGGGKEGAGPDSAE